MIKIENYYAYLITVCKSKFKHEVTECEDYVSDFMLKCLERDIFPPDLHLKSDKDINRFITNCFVNFKIDRYRWENRLVRKSLLNVKSTDDEMFVFTKGFTGEPILSNYQDNDEIDNFLKFNLPDYAIELKDKLSGLDLDVFNMHYLSNLTIVDIAELKKREGYFVTKRDIQLAKDRIRKKAKTIYVSGNHSI